MSSHLRRPASLDQRGQNHDDNRRTEAEGCDTLNSRRSISSGLRSFLPPLNFITLHYAYFIGTTLLASVIFYASSNPHGSISYVDSLFLVVSAMTEAGLNTVNLSEMTVWQQVMLWLLIIVGSSVWVSIWTVVARKHVFEKSLRETVQAEKERDQQHNRLPMFNRGDAAPRAKGEASVTGVMDLGGSSQHRSTGNHITIDTSENLTRRSTQSVSSSIKPTRPWLSFLSSTKEGRNAQFHSLTASERSRLGGHEYRALRLLSVVVPLYSVLWQVLGSLALGAWIANNMPTVATSNGANPWWAGIFFAVSAFNNSGMSLLDANMVPFQQAYFVLVTMGLLILAGNTAYPLFLRLIFWSALKGLRLTTGEGTYVELKSTLEFILKYPRRVYTNLFPSRPTWWLFFMVVMTNGIDWMAFEVLNIGNPIIESIPIGARVLDGLFQAFAVRSGGFYVIPIASAYPGLQVLYVIMMYISVYPVVITMRHSNVYEERSLGIYADDEAPLSSSSAGERKHSDGNGFLTQLIKDNLSFAGVGAAKPKTSDGFESRTSFVSQQIRGQLAHDLWLLTLAVLIIVTIETSHFLEDPVHFSVFNVVFEVVSGYGCVGISVGLPKDAMSFSGGWHAGSKLVLCLVMLRGRHRGLPVALDRAVRLPGQRLLEDEEEDWRLRRARSGRGSRAGLFDN
ncbi:low-affinity potassium transport protein [Colletotrichum spaethianum]|uniref:Low-affinity potassium transport protein n=1 Tax=Colletotrichum spaethianum TaxID=700344 RepID=A0AA37P715_9PEZI|nr:low-affinity potassium transport protein [Colletotrichum spaethianum]GKT41539.1 low-affinity potassium transport protein [Colletotrichum spaethianum]